MLWSLLAVVVLVYIAICVLLFAFQSRLVYFPGVGREVSVTPRALGLDFEDVSLRTVDGVNLNGWFVPARASRGVVLFFHGNAGNISHRLDWLLMFSRLGYASFIIDYRGYGRSEGKPSEHGTYRDAEAAWAHLTGARGIAPQDIVIFGESLGGAVAARLAAGARPRALVLHSAFTSLPDLGAQIYPIFPVRWLARIEYDTRSHLARLACPLLVAHSPDDEIVPFAHGRALFAAAPEPKSFLELAGGHNDGLIFARPPWVEALARFLERAERG
jgi:hypothetical protein